MQATTHVCVKENLSNKKRKQSRGSRAKIDYLKIPDEVMELMKEDETKTNYSGGIIAIFVIIAILGLIALATYLTLPPGIEDNITYPLTMEKMFKAQSLMRDLDLQYYDDLQSIVYRNSSNKYYRTLIGQSNSFGMTDVLLDTIPHHKEMKISPDLSYWLVRDQFVKINISSEIWNYNLLFVSRKMTYIKTLRVTTQSDGKLITHASWGPRGLYLAAITNGNLYWTTNPTEPSAFMCISCHLDQSRLYGIFIGYYKSHIFKREQAYWWNQDAQYLAFISMTYEKDKCVYEEEDGTSLYPKYWCKIRDPAYTASSLYQLKLYIASLTTQTAKELDISKFLHYIEYYLIHVEWITSTDLLVVTMKRNQREATILVCEKNTNRCDKLLTHRITKGFINLEDFQSMKYCPEKKLLIVTLYPSEMYAARKRIGFIKIKNNSRIKWIESDFIMNSASIVSLVTYLATSHEIVYKALKAPNFKIKNSYNRKIQQIIKTNILTGVSSCLTCTLNCTHNEAVFLQPRQSNVWVHKCSAPEPHQYTLHSQLNIDPLKSKIIESNRPIRQFLENISIPTPIIVPLLLTSVTKQHKYKITAKIYRPTHLNPEHIIKYPVILFFPDFQNDVKMNTEFNVDFKYYLVSYLHYVLIEFETRSSKTHSFFYWTSRSRLYNDFRDLDEYDILEGLKSLLKTHTYLDPLSICAIGSKYGAYLTLKMMQMSKLNPQIRCSVAINPILDFSRYNSFISERYFGLYEQNKIKYEKLKFKVNSNSNNKEILLIHDMTNEMNLFEDVAKYLKSLVNYGVVFNILPLYKSYGNDSNWLQDPYTLKYVTNFLVNCLNETSLTYTTLANNNSLHSIFN